MKPFYAIVLLLILGLLACKKESVEQMPTVEGSFKAVSDYLNLSEIAPSYAYQIPSHQKWEAADFITDDKKASLGRVLFYDKKLSKDGTISCGSCHQQQFAFADPAAVSFGVFNKKGTRNSMALGNFTSLSSFLLLEQDGHAAIPLFWDSRTTSTFEQIKQAITNEHEMGISMAEAVEIVAAQPYYPWLFEQAFGDSIVQQERISEALLHFMGSFHSFSSKFDTELAKTNDKKVDFSGFTASENLGKAIYVEHCDLCHGSLDSPQLVHEANNGLDSVLTDLGKGAISGKFYDNGTFKVPALRNIALTAPYMHDGRFETLDEVIEHYSTGVIRKFGLHGDLLVSVGQGQYEAKHLNLTSHEAAALKAFLETLTDEEMIRDERYSNPFK